MEKKLYVVTVSLLSNNKEIFVVNIYTKANDESDVYKNISYRARQEATKLHKSGKAKFYFPKFSYVIKNIKEEK